MMKEGWIKESDECGKNQIRAEEETPEQVDMEMQKTPYLVKTSDI